MAKWDNLGSLGDVEDRRGLAPVMGGIGLGGVAIVFLLNYLAGGDLGTALNQIQNLAVQTQPVENAAEFEGNDEYEVFASTVLGSANDMWEVKFNELGRDYEPPKLVLFRQATQSSCGTATSDVGPHYCPLDKTIYIDETFFDELTNRFGARGGDVAEAYVIAHEVGHHAQNELGILARLNNASDNETSIKIELQADCFGGLWANSLRDRNVFEQGEIIEAIDAAAAVGDDRIQESVGANVNPETWTHGSSEQRVEWFNKGYDTGDFEACNTL